MSTPIADRDIPAIVTLMNRAYRGSVQEAAALEATEAKVSAKAQRVAERKNWAEADRKAARDARYAARKARQGRR